VTECPRSWGGGAVSHPMPPPPVGPSGGVVQVVTATPFHAPVQFQAFLTQQGGQPNEYCEICRHHGHSPRHCPILQKYTSVPNTMYYELCGSTTHTAKKCHALDALADRLDLSAFRIDESPQGFGGGHRGRGAFRGGQSWWQRTHSLLQL
jgi:hypothetical protein